MKKVRMSDGRELYWADEVDEEIARLKRALGGKVENLKPREPKYNELQQKEIAKRVAQGESKRSLSVELGVSRATIGRYCKTHMSDEEKSTNEILKMINGSTDAQEGVSDVLDFMGDEGREEDAFDLGELPDDSEDVLGCDSDKGKRISGDIEKVN